MPNPWGAGSENINSVIMDSIGTNLTLKQTVSVPYTASSLNSCQWLSSSTVNGASSSRTISFIPSVQLIQTSYLQVTIPLWFETTSNVIGSSITCGSVSVYLIIIRMLTLPQLAHIQQSDLLRFIPSLPFFHPTKQSALLSS